MADDGAVWRNGLEAGLGPAAHARFQDVVAEFAERLASPVPLRREPAVALVQQLERLGRRMAEEQDAALAAITRRLEAQAAGREAELTARIDALLAELNRARAAKRPLMIGAFAAACAALSGAGFVALTRGPAATDEPAAPPAMPVEVAAAEPDVATEAAVPANTIEPAPPVVRVRAPRPERAPRPIAAPPDVEPADEVVMTPPAPEPDAVLNEASLKDTQTFLAQQGYYIGPIDGQVSVTLKEAAEAYLRDHKVATVR